MCKHSAFIILPLIVIILPTKMGSDFSRKTFGFARRNPSLAVKVTGTSGYKTFKKTYLDFPFKKLMDMI